MEENSRRVGFFGAQRYNRIKRRRRRAMGCIRSVLRLGIRAPGAKADTAEDVLLVREKFSANDP